MTSRAVAGAAAATGAAVFLVCCAVVRGGLFDAAPYGDVHLYAHFAHLMRAGQWPYRDFYDEYPPLAQPLFLVAGVLPGSYAPTFKWTVALCGAAAVVLLVCVLVARRAPRVHLLVATAVAAVSPLLIGPVLLNTYDLWPALLAVGALLALVRDRTATAFALIALTGLAKVFMYAALPVALVWAWRRGELRRAVVAFVAATVVVAAPFAVAAPGGLRYSYETQARRGLEIESLGASLVLAEHRLAGTHVRTADETPGGTNVVGSGARGVAAVSTLVEVIAILAVAWLFVRRRGGPLLTATVASVIAFVAFAKVLSPQYVAWLVPLVPAVSTFFALALVPVLLLTRVVFDHQNGIHATGGAVWVLLARNLLVVALYALLVARLVRTRTSRNT